MTGYPPIWDWIIVGLVGLLLGSFASALIWRVPRGFSWVFGFTAASGDGSERKKKSRGLFARSACPQCESPLTFYDLVPFFSWLFLKGRCRYCHKPIGVIYPAAEFLTLLACLGLYAVWGMSVIFWITVAAMPFLVALLFIDFNHMILPNQLVGILGLLGTAALVFHAYAMAAPVMLASGIFAAFLYAALAWGTGALVGRILRKEALGTGDVKFFAVAGIWLGFVYLPFFLILSGVAGIVIGLAYKIVRRQTLFPFGPALILSLYFSIILKGLGIVPFVPGAY